MLVRKIDHVQLAMPGGCEVVDDHPALVAQLRSADVPVREDEPLDGSRRVYGDDLFGTRIELIEPTPAG